MKTLFTLTLRAERPRDRVAVAAKSRQGGRMHDRRAARGGARNTQRDLLDEYRAEARDDASAETDA